MTRARLANRRPSERIEFEHEGQTFTAHVGLRLIDAPDGRATVGIPAEIFIEGGKPGSAIHTELRDAGLIISIAMQNGVPLLAFKASVSRDDNNKAASVMGAAIDKIIETYGGT